MTPEERSSFTWIQLKYGQMSLQAESLTDEVRALRAENAELKKKLEPKKKK